MAHLSTQLQHRFLARLLSPEETREVLQHLRGCNACRESLLALRSNRPGSLLGAILPNVPTEPHPSADILAAYADDDVTASDQKYLEGHLSNCELCRDALADVRAFREELQRSPRQEYAPAGTTSRPSESSGRGFVGAKRRLFRWFNQPMVFASMATAVALVLVLGFLLTRFPVIFGISGSGSGPQITITDGDHRTFFGPNGIVNPPAPLPKEELAALNHMVSPAWRDEPPALSPDVRDTLASLKRAPSVLLGQPPATVPFEVLSPVRTLVRSVRPTFKWTTATGATNYTIHVISDDRAAEEVATSPAVSPSAPDAPNCEWTMSTSLTPGKRYRWYVTAVVKDQEIDAPGIEQAQAKFAILTEAALSQLEGLSQPNRANHLIDGLLNLNAGLLDDAQSDFERLLADPAQTSRAKDFLNRVIAEIKRMKEA
jgi:hypothetical protein